MNTPASPPRSTADLAPPPEGRCLETERWRRQKACREAVVAWEFEATAAAALVAPASATADCQFKFNVLTAASDLEPAYAAAFSWRFLHVLLADGALLASDPAPCPARDRGVTAPVVCAHFDA